MQLALKQYQRESLDVLGEYAASVRKLTLGGAAFPESDAFKLATERDYYTTPHFGRVPYVCMRIPTGGGKTLMAAHAVGIIGRKMLAIDNPACLWITPSITIRDQTLRGLSQKHHPYRAALEEQLGGEIEVMTLEEALTRSNFVRRTGPAIVIVTTIQSYRLRGDADGGGTEVTRKIYEDNGYMKEPLEGLSPEMIGDLEQSDGLVKLSLANAIRVRAPVVVMDEAHNARTPTSFESLARFGPSFVLEMTATPELDHSPSHRSKPKFASNVLHSVSALALKDEGMIKLPVELENRSDWLEVLSATKTRREELEFKADVENEESGVQPIRPIALIQAQPNSKVKETFNVEVVKDAFINRLGVPEAEVKICTGSIDEIGDTDLMQTQCPVRYIITVDRLREGWDCPWAYVLGSIGNTSTATAVEQLIGRILRMPNATPTGVPALDRAYAFVLSEDVIETASKLRDRMIETCGFDQRSAADAVRVRRTAAQPGLGLASIAMGAEPDLSGLSTTFGNKVRWEPTSGTLVLDDVPTAGELRQLRTAVRSDDDRKAIDDFYRDHRPLGVIAKLPGEFAKPLRLPRLVVRQGGRRQLLEPIELEQFEWDLDSCDPAISESQFGSDVRVGRLASLDVESRGAGEAALVTRLGGEVRLRQLELIGEAADWSHVEAARWLDREIHRGDSLAGLPKRLSQPWLLRVVRALTDVRSVPLAMIVRRRHELAEVVRIMVSDHGRRQLRKAMALLIQEDPRSLVTDEAFSLEIEEDDYRPSREYEGGHRFDKHAFDLIADMNGEEVECAIRIDGHANVRRWLRNTERESQGGFWLPKTPGQFYPDFLVELMDGLWVLVEYKGKDRAKNPTELYKKDVGELWASRSERGHRFGWVVGRDWRSLDEVLQLIEPRQ